MAVCGRCLICGHKFDGDDTPDVAIRWPCDRGEECEKATQRAWKAFGEVHTHAICTGCHDILVSDQIPSAVSDLLALVRARRDT